MKYKAPTKDNKPYYVPFVVKSKDYLLGYLHATDILLRLFKESLKMSGFELNLSKLDFSLDSSRFNDVLMSGKRVSDCSDAELEQYLKTILEEKMQRVKETHPDNDDKVNEKIILKIECSCGLGYYSYTNVDEIPNTSLKCDVCGRIILDYTGHYDSDFDYDGETIGGKK